METFPALAVMQAIPKRLSWLMLALRLSWRHAAHADTVKNWPPKTFPIIVLVWSSRTLYYDRAVSQDRRRGLYRCYAALRRRSDRAAQPPDSRHGPGDD